MTKVYANVRFVKTLGHVTRSRNAWLIYQLHHTLLKILLSPDQAILRNLDKYHQ